jgi:hypothetical protein
MRDMHWIAWPVVKAVASKLRAPPCRLNQSTMGTGSRTTPEDLYFEPSRLPEQ